MPKLPGGRATAADKNKFRVAWRARTAKAAVRSIVAAAATGPHDQVLLYSIMRAVFVEMRW